METNVTSPVPSYVSCPKCGADRFLLSRRLFLLTMEGGQKQRNWASGENTSDEIVCAKCGTRLRWNAATQQYDVFEAA